MEVKTRIVDGITVIDFFGRLDTKTSGSAADQLNRIAEESQNILLNLENLDHLTKLNFHGLSNHMLC